MSQYVSLRFRGFAEVGATCYCWCCLLAPESKNEKRKTWSCGRWRVLILHPLAPIDLNLLSTSKSCNARGNVVGGGRPKNRMILCDVALRLSLSGTEPSNSIYQSSMSCSRRLNPNTNTIHGSALPSVFFLWDLDGRQNPACCGWRWTVQSLPPSAPTDVKATPHS
jgi:hypothetical protein